jgi:hypothetical protein
VQRVNLPNLSAWRWLRISIGSHLGNAAWGDHSRPFCCTVCVITASQVSAKQRLTEWETMDSRMPPSSITETLGARWFRTVSIGDDAHIVDQLIAERSTTLSRHPLWPIMRPLLLRFLHYNQAVEMADDVAQMSGWEAMSYLSALLSLNVTVNGIANLPEKTGFILAPSHPTGIADGIAVFDMLKHVRPDIAIFANRDAQRVAPGFRDLIIPVERHVGTDGACLCLQQGDRAVSFWPHRLLERGHPYRAPLAAFAGLARPALSLSCRSGAHHRAEFRPVLLPVEVFDRTSRHDRVSRAPEQEGSRLLDHARQADRGRGAGRRTGRSRSSLAAAYRAWPG